MASKVPVLTDAELTLRPLRHSDVPEMVTMFSDPASVRFTVNPPAPYRAQDAEAFLATGSCTWALEVDGRYAGQVGFKPFHDAGMVEIAFIAAPWARGRGWMGRAASVVLPWMWEHGLDGMRPESVLWRARVGNWGSRRIAWRHGFDFHGAQRRITNQRGVARDFWSATLLRGEAMAPRHPWHNPPVLDLAEVRLRPLQDDDVPAITNACQDSAIQQWLPMLPSDYGLADAQAHLDIRREKEASGTGLAWAICAPDTSDLAGMISLDLHGVPGAEVGYWVAPEYRDRGLATAAVRAVVRHAFIPIDDGGLGLPRVLLRIAEPNLASQRVALAAGFEPAGRDRLGEQLRDGTRVDMLRFDRIEA